MKLYSIASGSSGNCIYVGDDHTHILIDAGISKKRIEQGLHQIGLTLDDLTGIVVTHEHSDHIGGLGVVTRKCQAPVYATQKTIDAILQSKSLGKLDPEQFFGIRAGDEIQFGDILVNTMSVSHDAADPIAYSFTDGVKKVAVATDLGYVTQENQACLQNLDAILLESNHDIRMLQLGPYPYPLKQRILGNRGHLSNESAGKLLSSILHDDMKHIFLGHLSGENNLPELAYEAVRLEITMSDTPYKADDFPITVAKRHEPSACIEV